MLAAAQPEAPTGAGAGSFSLTGPAAPASAPASSGAGTSAPPVSLVAATSGGTLAALGSGTGAAASFSELSTSSHGTSFTLTGAVGAEVAAFAAAAEWGGSSGTLTLSEVPDDALIEFATLYATLDQGGPITASATFAGQSLGDASPYSTLEITEPFSYIHRAYKWDVTALVTGNDSYSASITGDGNSYGMTLVVAFSHPDLPAGTVVVNDGLVDVSTGHSGPDSESTTLEALPGSYDLWVHTVGDDGPESSEPNQSNEEILFNDTAVGGPLDHNLGLYASLVRTSVTTVDGTNTVAITSQDDWLIWDVTVLAISADSPQVATIGDYVWEDADLDGVQGPLELGLGDVTVNLRDDQGFPLLSTLTDEFGYYEFSELWPGTYAVEVEAPLGYQFTARGQGGDPALDSDVDPLTGWTDFISVGAGDLVENLDAGLSLIPEEPAAPIAYDDGYGLVTGTTLVVDAADGVASNDFDANEDVLSVALDEGPAYGTLSLAGDGSFSYTPESGFIGSVSFTYTASDGSFTSEPATVTLRVTSAYAPLALDDAYAVVVDGSLGLAGQPPARVADNDFDPDGDSLTAVLVSGPTHAAAFTFNADGTFEYVPEAAYSGPDEFTYEVSDGMQTSGLATVTIEVTPLAASAAGDVYLFDPETLLEVTAPGVLANDVYPGPTPPSITLVSGPTYAAAFTFNADGSFQYTPASGFTGVDGFVYQFVVGEVTVFATVFLVGRAPTPTGTLIIHNGLEDYSGGNKVDAKWDKGAVTVANLNDTDGDGIVDKDDNDVSVAGGNPPGRNEIDLMRLIIERPQPAAQFPAGDVRVRVVKGDVRIYNNGPAGKAQSKSNGEAAATIPLTAFTADSNNNGTNDVVLWAEARSASALKGIELAYEFRPAGMPGWVRLDQARATAVWVTASRTFYVRTDGALNPSVGPGGDIPELDGNRDLVKEINENSIAANGTRYGAGTFDNEATTGGDTFFGGRILWEFEVSPHGIESLGVRFDVTRQIQARTYTIKNGDATLVPLGGFQDDWPWTQNPVRDNELPNDDNGSKADEDNIPSRADPTNPAFKVGRIYSWDAPGGPLYPDPKTGLLAFEVWRNTFKEWVRVKLNNVGFVEDAAVEGSRASAKQDWSMVSYQGLSEYVAADKRRYRFDGWPGRDLGQTGVSAPVLLTPGGATTTHGTAAVTLLGSGLTDGYTATFSAAANRWTLREKVTGNSVSAVLVGNTWTLTLTDRLTLVITKGTTPFRTGDGFVFSVFTAQGLSNGSQHLWLDTWNVTAPP